MRGEIAKVRFLPLPRWTAAVVALAVLILGGALLVAAPSKPDSYVSIPDTVVSLVGLLSTMVFGVWLSTLDFGSGTLQRTLTAEPRRGHVLTNKLLLTLAVGGLTGLAIAAAAGGLVRLAATHAGVVIDKGDLAAAVFGHAPQAVTSAAIGFGFGLLARSLGGGIAAALVFVLVFDGIIGFIPGATDYTYGQLTQDLSSNITGRGDTQNGLAVSLIGVIAWCLIVIVPGWVRFLRSDLK